MKEFTKNKIHHLRNVASDSFFVNNFNNDFVAIVNSTMNDSQYIPQRESLFVLYYLKSITDFDPSKYVSDIIEIIPNTYFTLDNPSILDKQERLVSISNDEIYKIIVDKYPDLVDKITVDLAIICVKDNVAYFSSYGKPEIFLFRDNEIIDLNGYLKDSSMKNNVRVGSMLMNEKDVIITFSPETKSRIMDVKLRKVLENFSLNYFKPNDFPKLKSHGILAVGYKIDPELLNKPSSENINYNTTEVKSQHQDESDGSKVTSSFSKARSVLFGDGYKKTKKPYISKVEEIANDVLNELKSFPKVKKDLYGREVIDKQFPENYPDKDSKEFKENFNQIEEEQSDYAHPTNNSKTSDYDINDEKANIKKPEINFGVNNVNAPKYYSSKFQNSTSSTPRSNNINRSHNPVKPKFEKPKFESGFNFWSKPKSRVSQIKRSNNLKKNTEKKYSNRENIDYLELIKNKLSSKTIISLITVILIVFSIFYFVSANINNSEKEKQRIETQKIEKARSDLSSYKTNLTEATKYLNSNYNRSLSLLNEAKIKVDEVEQLKIPTLTNDIADARRNIQLFQETKIFRNIYVNDLNISNELSNNFQANSINGITLWSGKIYISDKSGKILEGIDDGTKLSFINIIPENKSTFIDSLNIDLTGKIQIYDKRDGLFSVSQTDKRITRIANMSNIVLGNVSDFQSVKSGNSEFLYYTNSSTGEIYRVGKDNGNYTIPELRIKSDITTLKAILVDNRVWVGGGNKLARYFDSKSEELKLSQNFNQPFQSIVDIKMNDKYIFIADDYYNKIFIFDKEVSSATNTLNYIGNISLKSSKFNSFDRLIGIEISNNIVYILDSKRIYRYPLSIPSEYLNN